MSNPRRSDGSPDCRAFHIRSRILWRSCLLAAVIAVLFAAFSNGAFAQGTTDRMSTPRQMSAPPSPEALEATAPEAPSALELPAAIADKVTIGLNLETSRLFNTTANGGSGFIPPDTMGAVGPSHIVEMINGNFEVFDKVTGTSLETRSLDSFWTNKAGLTIANVFTFDPRIVFDPASGRWFAVSLDTSDVDSDGTNETIDNIYLARSDTDDPRGDWDGVRFVADTVGGAEFHDYPTLSVDADGLYICTQDFGFAGGTNESCYSVPKADLLLATPSIANLTRFEATPAGLPTVDGSLQPALDFGLSDGRAALLGSTGTGLTRTDIFGSAGAGATLGTPVPIAGAPAHAAPPPARQPQDTDPADTETIENVAPQFVGNVFEQGNSLWAVHAVQGSGSNSALRWYEIDETTNTVLQTGLIDDPNRDFHEPSIAVSELGNVVIGYTCSGPTLAASVCVSVGETSAGVTTFEAPAILFTGAGYYYRDFRNPMTGLPNRNRWGDYSATVIDPVDSCSFWIFQEYVAVGATGDVGPAPDAEGGLWGTRAVELTFNNCAGGDLKVVKDCKPDQPLLAGETATCTILVENLGPGPALSVKVDDRHISNGTFYFGTITTTVGTCTATPNPQVQQGEVTCDLGRLAAGDTVTIKVPLTATEPQDINDHVTVSSSTTDPNLANNQAEDGVSVRAVADLALTKTDTPDPLDAGTTLTYILEVTNNGPSTAVNVLVEDFLPAGVSIVSVSGTGGAACAFGVPGDSSRPTTCKFSSLAPSASATMTIVVTVNIPGVLKVAHNDARVSSDVFDPINSNNVASQDTTIKVADLRILKASDADVYKPSSTIKYTVSVANDGPADAENVVVTDNLPDIKQAVLQLVDPNICTQSGLTLTCALGTIPAGGSKSFNIYVTIKGSKGQVSNTASVASPTFDPNAANNSSTRVVLIKGGVKVGMVVLGSDRKLVGAVLEVRENDILVDRPRQLPDVSVPWTAIFDVTDRAVVLKIPADAVGR